MALSLNSKTLLPAKLKITKSSKPKFLSGETTVIVYPKGQFKKLKSVLKEQLAPYQIKKIESAEQPSYFMHGSKGYVSLVHVPDQLSETLDHEGMLEESNYALTRDQVGSLYLQAEEAGCTKLHLHTFNCDYDEILGSFLGLEMAAYDFKKIAKPLSISASYQGELPTKAVEEAYKNAIAVGRATNMSRLLVDTPPSDKRPVDYAEAVNSYFKNKAGMKVTIWDDKKMAKEKMGCILGVGQGSVQKPRLVHLRYRPAKAQDIQPAAFVGKGITFDTGGLNLKGGANMRLMKKDMGGSAALVGLASWLVDSKSDVPCDIYLALAENSVDAESFRPSDVLVAKNGKSVEIDNTDAEGRLVMADALCVAAEAKGQDKPQFLIDVATLTGAIKVGLGDDIGGLFSNNDDLAFILQSCSQISGDPLWRMPIMESQLGKLKSDVADLANSGSGFGGAIRAAVFLREFTGDLPWAHLDIYGWNGSRQKAYRSAGGSGQAVQCLAQFISQI